jgi:hypothetical protein
MQRNQKSLDSVIANEKAMAALFSTSVEGNREELEQRIWKEMAVICSRFFPVVQLERAIVSYVT